MVRLVLARTKQCAGRRAAPIGRRFAAALLPRLFGTNPRSHHKGATGRVQTGDQRLPVLCHCQLGQDMILRRGPSVMVDPARAPGRARAGSTITRINHYAQPVAVAIRGDANDLSSWTPLTCESQSRYDVCRSDLTSCRARAHRQPMPRPQGRPLVTSRTWTRKPRQASDCDSGSGTLSVRHCKWYAASGHRPGPPGLRTASATSSGGWSSPALLVTLLL